MILWPEKAPIHKIAECGFFLSLGVLMYDKDKGQHNLFLIQSNTAFFWTFQVRVVFSSTQGAR